eukprot:CAMPEP_0178403798 /NCGR_PEP_ID=MMETSP0689_2-20121128/17555_1 /TAXON_ID=160604 /ORGANISM="Amphidinium massartii, Strain CS-259" /LENGTH=99 /DNA_ID=CAMNT_0020024765 /DNA_START=89 /DNA_END=384 /DNA_ORIENTATION=+
MARMIISACLLLAFSMAGATSADCPEQSSALLQHTQGGRGALRPKGPKKQKAKAKVTHAGTVSLMLAEMNEMIATKGQVGMDPDEIEHIHSIKALIDDT